MVDKASKRYAEAIFDIATEEKIVLEMSETLKSTSDLFDTNIDFKNFFRHPLIKKEEKIAMIEKLFGDAKETCKNVLSYLIEKGRISQIKEICEEFKNLYYEANNIVDVIATFASEISEQQKAELITKLTNSTKKTINLEVVLDKSLIGGGMIKIGDKIIDGSLRAQLAQMAIELLNKNMTEEKKNSLTNEFIAEVGEVKW